MCELGITNLGREILCHENSTTLSGIGVAVVVMVRLADENELRWGQLI